MPEKQTGACAHEKIEMQLLCPHCGEELDHRSLTRAELEAHAVNLPNREAMTLLGGGLLGGGLTGGGLPLGGTDPAGGAAPTDISQGATQSTTGSMGLVNKLMPDTSGAADQPYSPSTSSQSST